MARDRFIEDPEPADPLTTALVFFQLVVFLGCVLASKWFRGFLGWVRLGRPSRSDVGLTMAFVVVSSIALLVWRYTANPDLERYAAHAPDVPLYLIPPGLVALALLNATYEELVWRGVVMHGLHAACRSVWWALVLQALGFGLWHFRGFPSGWVGTGLAAIYALMMGFLRVRTRGMLAPWVAHVFVDVTIFVIVAVMMVSASP